MPTPHRHSASCALGLALAIALAATCLAYRQAPPLDRVGACGAYPTCRDTGCHITFPEGSPTLRWELRLDAPDAPLPIAYVPGRSYPMRLLVDDTASVEAVIWGFELAALLDCDVFL